MWFKIRSRITECEIRLDEIRYELDRLISIFDDTLKQSISLAESHVNRKDALISDVEKLKHQMELTIRAQCATYSAALERVQAMLEHEKKLETTDVLAKRS